MASKAQLRSPYLLSVAASFLPKRAVGTAVLDVAATGVVRNMAAGEKAVTAASEHRITKSRDISEITILARAGTREIDSFATSITQWTG